MTLDGKAQIIGHPLDDLWDWPMRLIKLGVTDRDAGAPPPEPAEIIEIELLSGVRVRVVATIEPEALHRVLAAVGAALRSS
jgi:hypothetical protein